MMILTRIKDWYLGGDPNDDSHLSFRTVGWGPFPMPGERGRRQHAAVRSCHGGWRHRSTSTATKGELMKELEATIADLGIGTTLAERDADRTMVVPTVRVRELLDEIERLRKAVDHEAAAEEMADALQEMLGAKLHITACFATEDGPMHMTREFDSVDDMADGLLAFMDQIRTIEPRLRPLEP